MEQSYSTPSTIFTKSRRFSLPVCKLATPTRWYCNMNYIKCCLLFISSFNFTVSFGLHACGKLNPFVHYYKTIINSFMHCIQQLNHLTKFNEAECVHNPIFCHLSNNMAIYEILEQTETQTEMIIDKKWTTNTIERQKKMTKTPLSKN